MCFPLDSAPSPFVGPTASCVITIGPGKKALARAAWGRRGTSVVSQGRAGSRARSPVWLPEHRGRGGQLALMELIFMFPLYCEVGWMEGSSEK